MTDQVQFDISGNNPTSHAKRILNQYAEDEAIKSISLKIDADFVESGTKQATIDNTPDSRKETTNNSEAEKNTKREKGDIRAETSHHRVLSALCELSNGDMVSGRKIKEAAKNVSDSSIAPALTQLWERKLVDRELVDDVANPYYEYKPTEYGSEKIEKIGDPTGE